MEKSAHYATSIAGAISTVSKPLPRWRRGPGLVLGLAALFWCCGWLPRSQAVPALAWTFWGGAALIGAWVLLLWRRAAARGRELEIDTAPLLRSHYIQASVQLCIYAYWGWHWPEVYAELPLILSQLVFLYCFEALLSWSRGRRWRLGCGPLPIVLSTNVFIWFKPELYGLQFLMMAVALLGKEFLRWERDGRRTHIFNPSAFALAIFSLGLLISGGTDEYSYAGRIADRISQPEHIYLLIFALGLVVQHFFRITLMTLAAAAALLTLNAAHSYLTGTYWFLFSNLPLPIFLGLHLLMTDPSTSPRTDVGKVLFGALYGTASFVLYGVLSYLDMSTVYDKLLPVPLLNLSVRALDRFARGGTIGRLEALLAGCAPARLNRAYMGSWVLAFAGLHAAGHIGAPHEGNTFAFWQQALDEGRPRAAKGLVEFLKSQSRAGHPEAWNELGMCYLEGKLVGRDTLLAVRCFARASALGSLAGAKNLVTQFLGANSTQTPKSVAQALDQLERVADARADGLACFLVGYAYESGHGRPRDLWRAYDLYADGCRLGDEQCCSAMRRLAPLQQPGRAR